MPRKVKKIPATLAPYTSIPLDGMKKNNVA
jgi:hypothetical protein